MSARKAGNGFVARENCFFAGGPTKQCSENLNDFRSERQTEPDLGRGLTTAGAHRASPLHLQMNAGRNHRVRSPLRHINLSLVEKRLGLLDDHEPKRGCGRPKLIACNFSEQLRVVM
jgi:hypothetical protein